jgi:hypothetical protein
MVILTQEMFATRAVSGIRLDGRIHWVCLAQLGLSNPIAVRVAEGASVPFALCVALYY